MTLRLNGSTSGYVEIDAPATAGSNTLVLPTGNGSNGQYLQTNGSGALSWATVSIPAGGKILQVVQNTYSTIVSSSSTTYVDTDLNATITPSSTNSKILVFVTQPLSVSKGAANAAQGSVRLVRGSTGIWEPGSTYQLTIYASGATTVQTAWNWNVSYLDSPNTTSATTYKTQMRTYDTGATISAQNTSSPSTMILMEVAA